MSENSRVIDWATTTVGEVATLVRGITYKKEQASKSPSPDFKPVLRANNINGVLNFDDLVFVPQHLISSDQIIKVGDIIFAMSSGSKHLVGKSARARFDYDGSYGAFCGLIRAHDHVNKDFLYYVFQNNKFRRLISEVAKGSNINNLKREHILDFEIALPPHHEQLRIVAKIEELFSELDKGIESLKTASEQIKVYRQALLKHAFEGKGLVKNGLITQPFGEDCFFTLGDVIDSLGQGWSPRCLETPSQSDDVWGVIKTTAIQPLHFNDTKNKQLPIGLKPRPHLEIIPGDVLITRAGPRTRVGIACFVKNARPKLMVCDKAYRLQVRKEKILPQYLVMLLNTSELLSELEKLKSGISDSGLNLTQDKFLTLKITVPSLEHQQIILADIEEKLTNVEFLETQIDNSLQQSASLRQSILKKAFSGRLVPQDPHDEPAALLLERIRATKQSSRWSKGKAKP